MTDHVNAATFLLLLICSSAMAQSFDRGCIMLSPVQPNTLRAHELDTRDLCTQDGKAISYLSVGDARGWDGKVVPPYNRVRMTVRGPATETKVTFQTPSATYRLQITP
ncbi:hypothetical protein [Pseudomonas mosselii]|uniref:hypothetical protein n=1 Tax=Pseudomonas mosselii TaxID=78327 RepID=UPI0021D8476F|nr:hypothetical protein [Pseudomonas mosselii]MCU9529348.1 hypothetical protein [Pseudomonas mosselii]MCU9536639.1 hypothetical protein [Pseudomonas mosselii]MCU9542259.1 hypothetical protein [Pseudomonas mosselii]MCU9548364.1 hypothetical protein [Pseudomonas mosselii]